MGSLKSPCTTSYRSSIETMALYCLVFEKIAFLYFGDRQTDKKTDEQMDRHIAWSRSRCRKQRLNKSVRRDCWRDKAPATSSSTWCRRQTNKRTNIQTNRQTEGYHHRLMPALLRRGLIISWITNALNSLLYRLLANSSVFVARRHAQRGLCMARFLSVVWISVKTRSSAVAERLRVCL